MGLPFRHLAVALIEAWPFCTYLPAEVPSSVLFAVLNTGRWEVQRKKKKQKANEKEEGDVAATRLDWDSAQRP